MGIKVFFKNKVHFLETSLEIKDHVDYVSIRGQDKHGIFCRVLPKKLFLKFAVKCIENPDQKLDNLIKRHHLPKYGHYYPENIIELEERGIMRCGRNIHTEQ